MAYNSTLYPLEASDDYGLQGIKDRDDLLVWLNSWFLDDDSRECRLTKLAHFHPDDYIE